jgi:hypothetical protein
MLKPTQDKEAKEVLEQKTANYIMGYGDLKEPLDCLILAHELLNDVILPELEKLGYHKGLPPSGSCFNVEELQSVFHPHKEQKPDHIEIDYVTRTVRNLDTGEAHEY